MSNREQRRAAQKSDLPQQIVRSLQEAGNKIKESQLQKQAEAAQNEEDVPQPQGMLPLPGSQEITPTCYEWVWQPILDTISIIARLHIKDVTWSVELFIHDADHNSKTSTPADTSMLHPEDAKKIGEAFLAAWNWQFIWKDHFADMTLDNARKPKSKDA